ncbi:4-hydroxyphenylacetate 3-hydroxylase N-terminal domain-containing protein [Embleya sp. MST-111070]|uniref:4-hydroxyphenylacetate 3-hydroxylase N-terminal domain-containing protein n=1 Tax=Embleya sp. MST-111070 TaxID=3398231 RepID=UPI003F73191A
MRTGAEYLSSLNDGRQVYLDGQAVENVTEHPAFAGVARTVAAMFDVAAGPERGMQTTRADGTVINKALSAPAGRQELAERRQAIETWAEVSHSWIGRSPDHHQQYEMFYAGAPFLACGSPTGSRCAAPWGTSSPASPWSPPSRTVPRRV